MLKKLIVLAVAVVGIQASAASPNIFDMKALTTRVLSEMGPARIPFYVGDVADYKIKIMDALEFGTMHMFVREETEEGIWLQQDVTTLFGEQKSEILFDAETGQVKKMLVNGEEQDLGEPGDSEIIDSKPDTVTVEAGTFECSYIKIHDKAADTEAEVWINPELVPMLGLIKQSAPIDLGGAPVSMTVELSSFEFGEK